MLLDTVIGLAGVLVGWFVQRWWFLRRLGESAGAPSAQAAYEVLSVQHMLYGEPAVLHRYIKPLYSGPDLHEAKRVYYAATTPKRAVIELYTRGNHTASRML